MLYFYFLKWMGIVFCCLAIMPASFQVRLSSQPAHRTALNASQGADTCTCMIQHGSLLSTWQSRSYSSLCLCGMQLSLYFGGEYFAAFSDIDK
jgi:hypothetical protein